jgi:hypothetical protein
MDTTTLTIWRRDVAGLSLADAARRNHMTQAAAAAFERHPGRATAAALGTYVQACGGRLRAVLEHGATRAELTL